MIFNPAIVQQGGKVITATYNSEKYGFELSEPLDPAKTYAIGVMSVEGTPTQSSTYAGGILTPSEDGFQGMFVGCGVGAMSSVRLSSMGPITVQVDGNQMAMLNFSIYATLFLAPIS